jgi:nitroreductase
MSFYHGAKCGKADERMTEVLANIVPGAATDIAEAIRSRQSIRSFLPTPIAPAIIREILAIAAYAPSGSNLQPWTVFVLTGRTLQALGHEMRAAYLADEPGHERDYKYYPAEMPEPFMARRRACGWGLYGTLGIARSEKARMKAQRSTNYDFFGAPVGMVFTIHGGLEVGSWMDYGGFLQSIMVAARGFGLHSCAQAAIAEYPLLVRRHVPVSAEHKVVCGMAVGYADEQALINSFRTERAGVDAFARFLD